MINKKKDRDDFIEEIMEYKAYSHRRRTELISSEHNSQELLDLFRDRLYVKIAKMTDDDIAKIKTSEDRWAFVYNAWDEYLFESVCTYIETGKGTMEIRLDKKKT